MKETAFHVCNPSLLQEGYVFGLFAISRIAPKLLHQFSKDEEEEF